MSIQISPIWVISLSKAEDNAFIEAIDQQFTAFTRTHFGFSTPVSGPEKWWGINKCNLNDNIAGLIANGIPEVLKDAYTFDATAAYRQNTLSVIVYADSIPDDTEHLKTFIQQIRDQISSNVTCYIYFIADVASNNWSEQSYSILSAMPADACIIMDECNMDPNNPKGYLDLNKNGHMASQNKLNRVALLILNLAIGHNKLYSLVQDGKKVFASGLFSLFFDKEVLKSKLAAENLTAPVLNEFFFALNREKWHEPQYETESLLIFKNGVNADSLYKELTFVFDSKFKEVSGFFKHAVSPWSLFSLRLLSDYFKGEVRSLLKKLVEFGRLLDAQLILLYKKHIETNKVELIAKLQNQIRSVLLSVWEKNDESRKTPIGIQQFLNQLDEAQSLLEKALKDINSPDEFYKIYIHQMPLTPPDIIFDSYRKIKNANRQGSMLNDLSEAESDPGKEEENLLNLIRNKLFTHPIPLGLIFRASILGMVLSVTTYAFIVAFYPNFLVNSLYFEEGVGRYLWMSIIFLLTIIISLLHYGIGILAEIRYYKKKYLAWVFHRIQQRLLEETRTNLADILETMIYHCNQIKTNIKEQLTHLKMPKTENDDFVENREPDQINSAFILQKESLFPETYFQQNVAEQIDTTSGLYYADPIAPADLHVHIPNFGEVGLQNLSQDSLYDLMISLLHFQDNYKVLCEDLISKEPDLESFACKVQLFFENLIQLPVNHINEFSFTSQSFDIIKSRSYPSAFNYVGLSSDEITRFILTLGETKPGVPVGMKLLIETSANGMTNNLPLSATSPFAVDHCGYIQVCNFYRLSSADNVRVK